MLHGIHVYMVSLLYTYYMRTLNDGLINGFIDGLMVCLFYSKFKLFEFYNEVRVNNENGVKRLTYMPTRFTLRSNWERQS